MKNLKLLLNIILVTILIACDKEFGVDPDPNEQKNTFTYIEKTIFRARCALSGCHSSISKQANLDLSTNNAYNNLVNIKSVLNVDGFNRVQPGNSDASFLIKVLDGSDPTRMPLGGPYLDKATINNIADWIDAGALNN